MIGAMDMSRHTLARMGRVAGGLLVAATMAMSGSAHAQMQRADVEDAIRQYIAAHPEELGPAIEKYLADNPEAVRKAIQALIAKRGAGSGPAASSAPVAGVNARQAIADNAKALFSAPLQTSLGAAEGGSTVVEFYDFNCGFCRRALGDTLTLLSDQPSLRIILKELPILGPDSVEAAKVAIALQMHHPSAAETLEFHRRLLASQGRVGRAAALAVAGDLGFDAAAIDKDAESVEVSEALQQSVRLASALGIHGTPGYVVGDNAIAGAVGVAALKAQIAEARKP